MTDFLKRFEEEQKAKRKRSNDDDGDRDRLFRRFQRLLAGQLAVAEPSVK